MLMPLTVVLFEFPAASTAVPNADWAAPSLASVVAGEHVSTPERLSAHVNDTVTGALYQPFRFAGGTAPVIVGAVLSMLTVADAVALLPALSEVEPVTVCAAPSVVSVTGPEHDAIPAPPSLHVKVTV